MHPDIVWPCRGTTGLECLSTGIDIAPMVINHLDGLVPEGLAPTYRSGSPAGSGDHLAIEDLGEIAIDSLYSVFSIYSLRKFSGAH